MQFENPWAFVFLLLPALLVVAGWRRSGKPSVSYSSLSCAIRAGRSLRQRLLWLPQSLVVLAVVLLIVAVARPRRGEDVVSSSRHGVAIEMLMDISSSMDISLESETEQMNRIDAAKRVFTDFIIGNELDLAGRKNDVVGLITFARYADTVCPVTTGLPALVAMVEELEVESRPNEDGTAYGDALVLAAARLMKIDEAIESRDRKHDAIKSKIIILLTDGENNCGKHLPSQAAALAQEWGVKIYAIFLGDESHVRGEALKLTATQEELIRICSRTGGICRMVSDYDSLRAVYAEIDALEKSEIRLFTDTVYRECFHGFAFSALLCLIVSVVLDSTLLRRTP